MYKLGIFFADYLKRCLICICLLFQVMAGTALAQTEYSLSRIKIERVVIQGNIRTHTYIIAREMAVGVNSVISVSDTHQVFEWERAKLWNTRLWLELRTAINVLPDSMRSDSATIPVEYVIAVKERWYTFVIPKLELADRSFNEWFYNRGAALNRLNYGVELKQNNTTGNNDPLDITFQLGFTRRLDLRYQFPYLDKAKKWGAKINLSHSTNKSVAVESRFNKQYFVKDEDYGRERNTIGFGALYRPSFFALHNFEISRQFNSMSDSLVRLNPDYFLKGARKQQYFQLEYRLNIDHRDRRNYPLKGYYWEVQAEQLGILASDNIRLTGARLVNARFYHLGNKFFVGVRGDMVLTAQARQPYINARALGYGERFVRGYDRYVIEGQNLFLVKTSLKYKLFDFAVDYSRWIKFRQFKRMPVEVYLKTYADAAYVDNPLAYQTNARFTNRPLSGFGAGLDIVTWYDVVFRIEYSMNDIGERGFFFAFRSDL